MADVDPQFDSTWRNDPELVSFKSNMEEYFGELDDVKLAGQLGAILQVELIESGRIPNDLTYNHDNVERSLALLLQGGLKPDEQRTALEWDRTRIGREVCLTEYLKRLIAKNLLLVGDLNG